MASGFFTVLVLLVILGIYVIAAAILHTISQNFCPSKNFYNLLSIVAICYIVAANIVLWIVVLFDLYTSGFMLCKCSCREYFVQDDPFYFRFEMGIWIINGFWVIGGYFVRGFVDIDGSKAPIWWIVQWAIEQVMVVLTVGGIAIIVSLIRERRKKSNESIEQSDIDAILRNKNTRELFKLFAQREWSVENLMIWVCDFIISL